MFDASAKFPSSSVLQGSLSFPGNLDSCLEVVAPGFTGKYVLLQFIESDFSWMHRKQEQIFEMKLKEMKLEHIMLSMKSPGEKIRKHITGAGGNLLSILKTGTIVHGKCIPSVCSDMDVYFGYHNFFINESVLGHAGQNITAWAINSHTVDDKIDLEDGDWVMIAIFVVFGVLILTGTVIDVVLNILHLDVVPHKLVQIFLGFSLYQNTLKLFNTRSGGSDSLDLGPCGACLYRYHGFCIC